MQADGKAQNSMDDLVENDTCKGERRNSQGRAAQAKGNAK